MFMRRFLGLGVVLAMAAGCSDTPTAPQPLEVPGPSFAIVGQGNGAIVDRFDDQEIILLTLDFDSGLYSVHYNDSDLLSEFLGCEVPAFSETSPRLNILLPNGRIRDQSRLEAYVIVNELGVDFCAEPLAEGAVHLNVSVSIAAGGPGGTTASFTSNGVITDNTDGSDVRLHHSRKGLMGPPSGTVSLR